MWDQKVMRAGMRNKEFILCGLKFCLFIHIPCSQAARGARGRMSEGEKTPPSPLSLAEPPQRTPQCIAEQELWS